MSTPLANLDSIRPEGVTSVNVSGARKMPRRSELCSEHAASQQPKRGARSEKKMAIPGHSKENNGDYKLQ